MKDVASQFIKQVHQLHSEVRGQINTWQGAQIENQLMRLSIVAKHGITGNRAAIKLVLIEKEK